MSISLHYLNGSAATGEGNFNRLQSGTHTVSGPLSINWANGNFASISASANIVGFVDSNRPAPGFVVLELKNTGVGVVSVNLAGTGISLEDNIPVSIDSGETMILFGINTSEA